MKKNIIILFLLILTVNTSFAVNWNEVNTPLGKTAYLDLDSITEENGYYFYNIKVFSESKNNFSVITIQSSINKPFSARINAYDIRNYEQLNGDYDNITAKKTKDLEPVTYVSIVNSCYRLVKFIKTRANTNITF